MDKKEKVQVNERLEDLNLFVPKCICGNLLSPGSIDAISRIRDNLKSNWYCKKCGKIYRLNKRKRK